MQLFLQLNLAELPRDLEYQIGTGLLQLFYCTNGELDCATECEAFFPFARSTVVRLVNPVPGRSDVKISVLPGYFPAKVIRDWKPLADFPHFNDYEDIGLKCTYKFPADDIGSLEIACTDLGIDVRSTDFSSYTLLDKALKQVDEACSCAGGDKLGGWPCWVQGAEYPNCPICGMRMRFIFQLDSRDNLPYDFGDCGTGHITQCPTHKDQLAFGWACC
jgi:hypothetical protein